MKNETLKHNKWVQNQFQGLEKISQNIQSDGMGVQAFRCSGDMNSSI